MIPVRGRRGGSTVARMPAPRVGSTRSWSRRWTRAASARELEGPRHRSGNRLIDRPGHGSGRRQALTLALGGLVGGLVLAGCDLPRFGAPDSASEEGDHVLSLWSGFFIAACAVVLLIWGLLAWVLIRYRRKGRDDIPNQRAYNIPLEILYTIIPVLIVAVLFAFSWRAERKVTDVASDPAVEVRVVGFQWGWQFQYADGFTVTADAGEDPVLVLPVGGATNLELVSVDVAHSFWVPDFLNKRDLIPGVDNTITVRPTRTGTFVGRCAEFCGLDHWRMQFSVEVVSAAEYERWAAEQPREAPPALPDPPTTTTEGGR